MPPTHSEPQGLMAFTATISPPSYVLRYQQWHNCEHIPERVLIPGFLEGRRYRLFPSSSSSSQTPDPNPRFLMFYHTTAPSILSSPPYHHALSNPTPWTLEALSHFTNPIRDIYTLLASHGTRGSLAAPYIVSLRFDFVVTPTPPTSDADTAAIAAAAHQRAEQLYTQHWLPKVAEQANVQRVRLYRADKEAGHAATSERAQHGGGPGREGWLLLVELRGPLDNGEDGSGGEDLFVAADRELREEGTGDGGRVNETREAGWLEMVHVKQE